MVPSAERSPASLPFPLDAHLPLDRRWALAQRRDLPERDYGTVLFADLSGFTPLMERLANSLGPQRGAEELTRLLNGLFTPLIADVHRHGGSIIALGGDALACWFPDSGLTSATGQAVGARSAAACALAMQRRVADFPAETAAGPASLAMHIGLATGPVRRFCVGRFPYGRGEVLAGATIDRMAEAQQLAATGQVVVDAATAAVLPEAVRQLLPGGYARLVDWAGPPPQGQRALPPPLSARRLRPWLAEPLYARLRAGRGAFAAELRLVTPMFVQFAGLDYDNDPAAGTKLQQYVALAQEHLAPYEGYLVLASCGDKGSLLYIVFGAPLAHEDDPQRAVGFARQFQEAVRALPFITAQRIGLSVGRAYAGILGSPERCTYTVMGDEVNVSARLMQAAAEWQILVSRAVQRAAGGRYAFHSRGRVAVKGKEEPVPALEPAVGEPGHPPSESVQRLVGRLPEQQAMAALLDVVPAGRGQVLLIRGEAGVGKSALVRHLLRQAQGRGWSALLGSCLSYGQHIPYLPWRLILEEIHHLHPALGPDERKARLSAAVEELPDPPGAPGYWRARFPLLAEAMGLEIADTPLTRSLEGELRRDNTFQLLEALVRRLAADRPAVVVLEDAYWADELSLQLAAHIGRGLADLPLLLVLVQRPATREPEALQSLPGQMSISLDPLEPQYALELARQRLSAAALPPELERLLQQKAQGNPFFIEELLRALLEAGCLRRQDHTVELGGDWRTLALPDTIEGVVQARLDRLPEEEHLTLKVASVIGRTFGRPLLREVHPAQPGEAVLSRQLERLGEAAFLLLEQGAPEWRYAFQHPILHEVTYGTLLFAQRRTLHGEIGAALERRHAADLPRVLDLLAYHYARSAERGKAIHYLQRAAEKARREYANEVALGYYSQALERLSPGESALRYDLLAGRERIHDLLGDREAQEADLLEMGRLAAELADARRQVEVLNRRARRAADTGAFEEGLRIGREAQALAWRAGDLPGEAEAGKTLGVLHASLGAYPEAQEAFQRALRGYQALGMREGELTCLNNLGLLSRYRGSLDEARSFYEQALEIAGQVADRRREGQLLLNVGLILGPRGEYEQARAYGERAAAILQEVGDLHTLEIDLENLGATAAALGDLDSALGYHRRALELARRLEDSEGEATSHCSLGKVYIQGSDYAEARLNLRVSLRRFRQIGHRRGESDALHNLGLLELQAGRPREAARTFRRALALRREIGEAGNALVTNAWLGLALATAGEQTQAQDCLQAVLAQIESEGYGGDSPEQEVWWAAYRIWQMGGEAARAGYALAQAHRLVQDQAGRIADPARRRSFLEQVPINREIEAAGRLYLSAPLP